MRIIILKLLRSNKTSNIFIKELSDNRTFREFYTFTFNFGLNENQKSLELEIALAYWDLVMRARFRHLDLWLEFVRVSCCLKK